MPLASSSRVQLRSSIEATFGSEAAATARRTVRMTGESLNYAINFDSSKEIRSDRQTADAILLGASASGDVNFELAYGEYDDFFQDALQSTWTAFNTTGISPTITSPTFATGTLTQTAGTSFATIGLGQWVRIAGCTTTYTGNNGCFQTSLTVPATATVLTFEGTPFTAGAATGTVTLSTSRIANGTTQRSRLLEVQFADVVKFLTFRGMTCSKMSLNFAAQAVATGAFGWMGADAMALTGASNLPGTDDISFPTTSDVLNTSSNVAYLYESGAALTGTFAKSVSIELDNSLRSQTAVASTVPVGIGSGTIKLTGKLSAYFANSTLYDKFVNNTDSSIAIVVTDPDTNGYAITLPAIEFSGGTLTAGAMDQDIMVDLDFTAKIDTVSGKMILIDRFGAAV